MTPYSCLIIDSNKFFSGILSELVVLCPELELVDVIKDGNDHSWSTREDLDVIFYDPDVLGSRGRELLNHLPGSPQLIIISSDEEYAIQALMSNVTDFLEKSILTSERFEQTVSLIRSNARERVPVIRD